MIFAFESHWVGPTMTRGAALRFLVLFVALASGAAPVEVGAQVVTSHAQFASGYPTVVHHAGTNTATVTAALDRPATAFYVVVQQPNGLAGGAVTELTPDEIFAGDDASNINHRSDVFAAGTLVFTSANAEVDGFVDDVPDEAVYDVFWATHTGDANDGYITGVASPSSATVALLSAMAVQDVTPPSFTAGTPFVATTDSQSITLGLAVSESATVYILALPADAPPPESAADVIAGVLPEGMSLPVGYHRGVTAAVRAVGSTQPSFNASLEDSTPLGGDSAFTKITSPTLRTDTAYVLYIAVADTVGNTAKTVSVLAARTLPCTPCAASQNLYLSGFSCVCVEGLRVVMRLSTSIEEYEQAPEYWLSRIALSIGVLTAQTSVVSYEEKQGALEVIVLVLTLGPDDLDTKNVVQFASNNGGETPAREVVNVSLVVATPPSVAPETKITPTVRGRPGGATSPLTDDGRLPGHILDKPTDKAHATFRWSVTYNETKCLGCTSECKLDTASWEICTSPVTYHGLSEGEHNFRVRGVGGNSVVDPTPARYTWTIRVLNEARFIAKPPFATNVSDYTFALSSNRVGSTFQYAANENVTGGDLNPFPEFTKIGRDGSFPITSLNFSAVRGFNTVLIQALSDGEVSPSTLKHKWNLDLVTPSTHIYSPTIGWNNSRVSKKRAVEFTLVGDDFDAEYFPVTGVVGFRVRLTNSTVLDIANATAVNLTTYSSPLFDYYQYSENLTTDSLKLDSHTKRLTFFLGNVSNLTNGAYIFTATAIDAAGNYAKPDLNENKYGVNHYHMFLTDEIPGPAVVENTTTLEDFMTPAWNDKRCQNVSQALSNESVCVAQLTIKQIDPQDEQYTAAYQITNITGGVLFYPDGVTRVNDYDFVPSYNASLGLRFLNYRDLNGLNFWGVDSETNLPDESLPLQKFGFIAWPSFSLQQSGVINLAAQGLVNVTPVNDPPVLNRTLRYALDDVYTLDSHVTNFGSYVYKIIANGFFDVDGVFNETIGNQGFVVVGVDASRGSWQWSANDGFNWTQFPSDISPIHPLLLRATEHDRVRYLPNFPVEGLPLVDTAWSASFVFRMWDVFSNRSSGERGWWVRGDNGSVVPPELVVPSNATDAEYYDYNNPTTGGTALNSTNASSTFIASKGFAATWTWFDGQQYMAYGNEISMDTGVVTVDVTGVKRSRYTQGGASSTLAAKEASDIERTMLECGLNSTSLPFHRKAPSHGVAFSLRSEDPYASLVYEPVFDVNQTPPSTLLQIVPPWTIEAWVRSDRNLAHQALFTGADGGSLLLETPLDGLPGAASVLGVASPSTMAALTQARHDFDHAQNNSMLDDASRRVDAARASIGFFKKNGVAYAAPTGEWHHLAFVAVPDGTPFHAPYADVRLHVDGLYYGTATGDFGFNMPIGVIGGPGRASFAIDEVRAWNLAVDPATVWSRFRSFVMGDELGLLVYLPMEEGCLSNVTFDRSAVAFVENRPAWQRNGTYAPFYGSDAAYASTTRASSWERREQNAFSCAEVSSIFPSVISSTGGDVLTLHGNGFRSAIERMEIIPDTASGKTSTRNDTKGTKSVCRFGVHGSANAGVFETSANIASDGLSVTCVAPNIFGDWNGGAVVVEFCDPSSSCCSSPEPLALMANRNLYPANFFPPSLPVAQAERSRVLFRRAKVVSSSPASIDARVGAIVTLKGWGFVDLDEGASCVFAFKGSGDAYATITVTSDARVISSAGATCEFPSVDESLISPGARVTVTSSLLLHGGSLVLASPSSLLVFATDAPGSPPFQLAQSTQSVWNETLKSTVVEGSSFGGSTVALEQPTPEDSNFSTARFDPLVSGQHKEHAIDAACAFGTTKVSGRNVGLRRVECTSPSAPRVNASVPLSATPRRFGNRFSEIGVRTGETKPGAVFQWIEGTAVDAALVADDTLTVPRVSTGVVAFQGPAPGPADGGWFVLLRGFGFIESDSCFFESFLSQNNLNTVDSSTVGRFISSALLLCEVPSLVGTYATTLGIGGEFESIANKRFGAIEFTATIPVDQNTLPFVDQSSMVLAEQGGSFVRVVRGGISSGNTGGVCRFRAVHVASRVRKNDGAKNSAECVSPALAHRVVGRNNPSANLVDFAVASSHTSGLAGSVTPGNAERGLVIAPFVDGAVAVATASPAPPSGSKNAVSTFFHLDFLSAAPHALAQLLDTAPLSNVVVPESNPLLRTRVSMACIVYSGNSRNRRTPRSSVATAYNESNGTSSFATCDVPPAPFELGRSAGFSSISVVLVVDGDGGEILGSGIVSGAGATVTTVEFEWAPAPRPFMVAGSRTGFVPQFAIEAGTSFHAQYALSSIQSPPGDFFTASGFGSEFRDEFNATRVYADIDEMDLGGAWWHLDGDVGRHAAPLALSGKDFRNGPGLRVRFTFLETEASNEESSFQVSVPGFFVSGALLLVEPPPLPQRIGDDNSDVLLDVSIDGGNSWSKQAASFRIKASAVS